MEEIMEKHTHKRIQIDLPLRQYAAYQNFLDECQFESNRDCFTEALTILEWAVTQRRAGRVICSYDEKVDRLREFEMPVLHRSQRDAHLTRSRRQHKAISDFMSTIELKKEIDPDQLDQELADL
jgi:hypothetical protein